jgi:NADP-dependent 3-hydroxy acid dehydrogenase YdfG
MISMSIIMLKYSKRDRKMSIQGKDGSPLGVAVVTGASAGNGKVYADRLAKHGYESFCNAHKAGE